MEMEVVVGAEEGVEPEVLRGASHGKKLLVAGALLGLRKDS
jgi:hypothetical protein